MGTVKVVTIMLVLLITIIVQIVQAGENETPVAAIEDVDDIGVGESVLVEGGLVVTVLKKPKKCIRQASAGDKLSVHYTGRLGGGDGDIFDTSVKKRIPYN